MDNSFGTAGIDTIFFGAGGSSGLTYEFSAAYCVDSQDDGKFIMAGGSGLGTDTFGTVPVAKYHPNGTLDESFGDGGKVRIRFPNYKEPLAWDAVIDQHHNIILTGQCANNFSGGMIFTLRLLENGELDTTFGEMGISYTSVDSISGSFNWGRSVAIDGEQRIVVAADSYNGATVLRYLSGFEVGILDLTKVDNPLLIYPNPVTNEARLNYQLLADEEISIMLYNLQGQLVQTFINRASRSKGYHEEVLKLNYSIVPGSYIVQIENGIYSQGIKIMVE